MVSGLIDIFPFHKDNNEVDLSGRLVVGQELFVTGTVDTYLFSLLLLNLGPLDTQTPFLLHNAIKLLM